MNSILLVENDPSMALSLTEALTRSGFFVHCEHEGRRAIAAARKIKFKAAVISIGLPDLRGDEVSDELRSLDRGLPIFICTATESRAIAQWAKLVHVRVLHKPVDESELALALHSTLPAPQVASHT
ncbi:MAG TPA: response regulator [Steroidobacter sp.]|uniref:response regulator n=1 Tax=Steroidobacter sp. TaxID=1978227 RepID=UPI002EDB5728